MSLTDRISPLCDLLLGAAYADAQFKDHERDEVRGILEDLSGGELSTELELQLGTFDPKALDLGATAAHFLDDSEDDRRRILFLIAAIHDADDEVDFAEDAYLRAVAAALQLPPAALDGLTVEVEVEVLRTDFARARKPPPLPPGAKKPASVDIDVDLD